MPEELFVRLHGNAKLVNGGISFAPGAAADFDTYFNSFSLGKWQKYTKGSNYQLRLRLRGEFQVALFPLEKPQEQVREQVRTEQAEDFCFSLQTSGSVIGFRIEATGGGELIGGAYICAGEPRDVSFAVAMCTYKREAYVRRNVGLIQDHNRRSGKPIQVYIADNGRSEELVSLRYDPAVHLFSQQDLGGSAGNMKCVMEILKDSRQKDSSYIILLDDDVMIFPSLFERVCAFASLLAPPYWDREIAGGMFSIEKPYLQHELGAVFHNLETYPLHHDLDLRQADNILRNEDDQNGEYGAGYLKILPCGVFRDKGLYFPAFLRYDDVEWSMRSDKGPLTLNGIQVWHEDFVYKDNASVRYYNFRNGLVTDSMHPRSTLAGRLYRIAKSVCFYSLCQHYGSCEAILAGVRDYMKGPRWLAEANKQEIYRHTLAFNPDRKPLEESPPDGRYVLTNRFGWKDFSAFHHTTVINECHRWQYRVGPNLWAALRVAFLTVGVCVRYGFRSRRLIEKYRRELPVFCTSDYWQNELHRK